MTAVEVGDDPAALSARQRLAPLLDEVGDPFLRALCDLALASNLSPRRRPGRRPAGGIGEPGRLRGQDAPFWIASAGISLGSLETAVGRDDDALGHLTEVRDLAERSDNAWPPPCPGCLATLALVRAGRRRPERCPTRRWAEAWRPTARAA